MGLARGRTALGSAILARDTANFRFRAPGLNPSPNCADGLHWGGKIDQKTLPTYGLRTIIIWLLVNNIVVIKDEGMQIKPEVHIVHLALG